MSNKINDIKSFDNYSDSLDDGYVFNVGLASPMSSAISTDSKGIKVAPRNITDSGLASIPVAAAASASAKKSAGVLCRVLVTTAGTASITIYDNASAAGTPGGTIIGFIPGNATANGVPFVCNMPAANGINIVGQASSHAVTVSYY